MSSKLKTYTLEEITDKHIGKRGTPKREVFEDRLRRDLVRDVIEEALEDAGMVRAIEEGAKGDLVSREEIFTVLKARN